MDRVQLSQSCRANMRRQLLFKDEDMNSWYSFDPRPRKVKGLVNLGAIQELHDCRSVGNDCTVTITPKLVNI